jgi:hypothetical protein
MVVRSQQPSAWALATFQDSFDTALLRSRPMSFKVFAFSCGTMTAEFARVLDGGTGTSRSRFLESPTAAKRQNKY